MTALEDLAFKVQHNGISHPGFPSRMIEPYQIKFTNSSSPPEGYSPAGSLDSRLGSWQVYERLVQVPNFGLPPTDVYSKLGIYQREGRVFQLAKFSGTPIDDFESGLSAFAAHYLERPVIFGYPSKVLNETSVPVLTAVGTIAGVVSSVALESFSLGALTAIYFSAGLTGMHVLDKVAVRPFGNPGHWYAGRHSISHGLDEESHHRLQVRAMEDVYNELNAGIDRDTFASRVWPTLPQTLVRIYAKSPAVLPQLATISRLILDTA